MMEYEIRRAALLVRLDLADNLPPVAGRPHPTRASVRELAEKRLRRVRANAA